MQKGTADDSNDKLQARSDQYPDISAQNVRGTGWIKKEYLDADDLRQWTA
jgi:hypothetical protein